MALLVFLLGRAFCGWICPVPVLGELRAFFRSPKKRRELEQAKRDEALDIAKFELGCGGKGGCESCSACKQQRTKLDSRHYVLGGALLSTAIFGFPVFCLVCPIGLTFATVLVFWRLFANADMTVAVVLIPLMLIIELVFLRKWCTRFCPMAGLMNLMGRFSRMFKPVIDDAKCLETSKGTACSRCAMVCEADINLRHPDYGERTLADCTRCNACVDACPANAITMPVVAKRGQDVKLAPEREITDSERQAPLVHPLRAKGRSADCRVLGDPPPFNMRRYPPRAPSARGGSIGRVSGPFPGTRFPPRAFPAGLGLFCLAACRGPLAPTRAVRPGPSLAPGRFCPVAFRVLFPLRAISPGDRPPRAFAGAGAVFFVGKSAAKRGCG